MGDTIRCALFDIDGTLVSMRGAGARAMDRAFERLTGIPDAFRGVPMAGRTDRAILETALQRQAASGRPVAAGADFHRAFTQRYLAELEREVPKPGPTVCPGVIATLDELERRGVALGLGTGNYAGAARIKLERFGLWSRFAFGGYGDATCDRTEVVGCGVRAAAARCGVAAERMLVIGDTLADIAAGRAVGARVLSVGTGPAPLAELVAGKPDAAFPTLLDALAAGFWAQPAGKRDQGM